MNVIVCHGKKCTYQQPIPYRALSCRTIYIQEQGNSLLRTPTIPSSNDCHGMEHP